MFEKTHFFTSNESIDEEKTKLMVGQNNPILTDAQRLEKMQGNKITMFPECVCELFDMSQLEDNIQLEVNQINLLHIITKITILF